MFQYFETLVRYDRFFTSQPNFIPEVLVRPFIFLLLTIIIELREKRCNWNLVFFVFCFSFWKFSFWLFSRHFSTNAAYVILIVKYEVEAVILSQDLYEVTGVCVLHIINLPSVISVSPASSMVKASHRRSEGCGFKVFIFESLPFISKSIIP